MIAGFFGIQSSGKGIISTIFLREMIKNYPKRVIANCFLNEKNLIQLTSEELYLKSKTPGFFVNSYLYITELHNIIDARRPGSLMNTNFTQFLTQIGKIDCSVVYDSQLFDSQIDLRMREFTTLKFKCERFKIINGHIASAILDDRVIKDKYGNLVPIAIKISLDESTSEQEKIRHLGYYLPSSVDYAYYKTREIVTLDREKHLRK